MLADARSDTGWASGQYQGADMLMAISGQSVSDNGCVPLPLPSAGGQHPPALVKNRTGVGDSVVHEVAHNYGFPHHNDTYRCMLSNTVTITTQHLGPAEDRDMAVPGGLNKRTWY